MTINNNVKILIYTKEAIYIKYYKYISIIVYMENYKYTFFLNR